MRKKPTSPLYLTYIAISIGCRQGLIWLDACFPLAYVEELNQISNLNLDSGGSIGSKTGAVGFSLFLTSLLEMIALAAVVSRNGSRSALLPIPMRG